MLQLIFFSFILSAVHALIPHHWLSLALLARSEKWSKKQTFQISFVVSFAHTLSTIILGVLIGLIGMEAAKRMSEFTSWFAPLLLILFGIIYISFGQEHHHIENKKIKNHSFEKIMFSMALTMFFSPCLEVETLYFAAGTFGWQGILFVSLIYLIVTVCGITILALSGKKTIEKLNFHFLEHNEKKIAGMILILLGIMTYFLKF
ncbi:MAG: hypothetical protein HUU47_02350 [Bacteroidetes bacterium]|nr:hypothetical protein [Bacteroidota bacterium]